MRILVTAGNTQAPIDRVRCITNIFTGRTGASIALEAYRRGHDVTLLTSHPEVIDATDPDPSRWHCLAYRTFDDLAAMMEKQIKGDKLDAIIHCAAVSDYLVNGIYAPAPGTEFARDVWPRTRPDDRLHHKSEKRRTRKCGCGSCRARN